jgi:hypothetical protein
MTWSTVSIRLSSRRTSPPIFEGGEATPSEGALGKSRDPAREFNYRDPSAVAESVRSDRFHGARDPE